MDTLIHILDSYGYGLLFLLGFAEYAGVPIASVPLLIGSGALARAGGLSLPLVVASAAAGGLLADASWYSLARWKGRSLVGMACGLSSNRRGCVLGVEQRACRLGTPYVLFAKFIPGAGNLIAPAAGFGGIAARRFLLLDGAGLLAWGTVYAGAGWWFSESVEALIGAAAGYARWILLSLPLFVLGAAAWRYEKVRRHRAGHAEAGEPPDAVAQASELRGCPPSPET